MAAQDNVKHSRYRDCRSALIAHWEGVVGVIRGLRGRGRPNQVEGQGNGVVGVVVVVLEVVLLLIIVLAGCRLTRLPPNMPMTKTGKREMGFMVAIIHAPT